MFRFGSDRLPVPFIFILSRIRLLNFTDTGTVPSFMESFRSSKKCFFISFHFPPYFCFIRYRYLWSLNLWFDCTLKLSLVSYFFNLNYSDPGMGKKSWSESGSGKMIRTRVRRKGTATLIFKIFFYYFILSSSWPGQSDSRPAVELWAASWPDKCGGEHPGGPAAPHPVRQPGGRGQERCRPPGTATAYRYAVLHYNMLNMKV